MIEASGSVFGDNIIIDVIMFIATVIQGIANIFN